jgi:hypothetical protein
VKVTHVSKPSERRRRVPSQAASACRPRDKVGRRTLEAERTTRLLLHLGFRSKAFVWLCLAMPIKDQRRGLPNRSRVRTMDSRQCAKMRSRGRRTEISGGPTRQRLHPDFEAMQKINFPGTLRTQPGRLIWPTTKKYPRDEGTDSGVPRHQRSALISWEIIEIPRSSRPKLRWAGWHEQNSLLVRA